MLPTVTLKLDIGGRTLSIDQLADLDKIVEDAIVEKHPNPYWAYLWPSARAVAKEIGTGDALENLRVLDLGCGLGALGVTAAACGAKVLCADIAADALELAAHNAAQNNLSIETMVLDWTKPPPDLGRFDRIYAGDVFYEDGMLSGVIRFLRGHLAFDGKALVGDPMRVPSAGIQGAARLNGLEVESRVLQEGQIMTGGVTLHTIRHRTSKLRPQKSPL